jgi:protein-S-isoprenylcysteine O-methyltransferase Ste14
MKRLAAVALRPGIPDMVRFETPSAPRPVLAGDLAPEPSLVLGDFIARVVIVALFTFMAYRIGSDFLQSGRTTGLLLLASEGLVVILTVFRRPAGVVDRSPRARILMVVSLMGPVLVTPAAIPPLLPELTTVAVSACGLLVVIIGKLSLGRSFGLMPANRGVVSTGLYRIVRHPIYMGYLVTHAAFCVANPTPGNLMILLAADIALLIRAVCEEQTLARDAAYRDYQRLVRWRVLPGVF